MNEQESEQFQAARYGLLSEIVLLMAQTADLQRLLKQLINKVKWVLDFERCTLALLNPDNETYQLQTLLETRRAVPRLTEASLPLERGINGQVMFKQQMLLASFPELNPGPIIETDLDGQVYYLNPAGQELFPDCLESGAQHALLSDLRSVATNLEEDGKNSFLREIKIGDIWYQQAFHLVPNSERVRFYVVDISERKRAEEALQQQNEYLAALHDTTLGLISRLDLNELLEALISRAGQLLGTIGMAYPFASAQSFGAAEMEHLTRFSELASLALDNARLFAQAQANLAETEEQARRLSILNEMGKQMSLANTTDEIFSVITSA